MGKPKPLVGSKRQLKARWRQRIKRIQRETTYVFENRLIFREVQEMFRTNPVLKESDGIVYDWLAGMYGRDGLMAVRRELDNESGVVNLVKLLHEIEKRPEVISRRGYSRFSDKTDKWVKRKAREYLAKLEAPGKAHIDPNVVRADREALQAKCKISFQYAQRMVAHRTPTRLTKFQLNIWTRRSRPSRRP